MENLCESTGNDIRQCLNFLEMRSRRGNSISNTDKSNNLNTNEMKNNYDKYCKDADLMINGFDSCNLLATNFLSGLENFNS